MRADNGSILLSPSDLTAYLACEHLTTLALQVARGELVKPEPTEQAELLFEKGLAHEAAYLARLRDEGLDVREITTRRRLRAPRLKRPAKPSRPASTSSTRASSSDGRWRGRGGLPRSARTTAPTRRSTPSSRAARSPPTSSSSASTTSSSGGSRAGEPEHIHVLLGSGERQSFRPQEFDAYARRVRRRLERLRRRRAGDRAVPVRPLRDLRLPRRSATPGGRRSTTSPASPAVGRRQIEKLAPAGITTLPRSRERRPSDPPPGLNAETFAKLQRQAALQLERRDTGKLAFVLLDPQPERGLRAAARPLARRPLLRHRGQPVLGRAGKPRVPLGRARRRRARSRRSGPTTTPSERRALRGVRRPRPRAPARAPRHARLPLRRLRGHARCAGCWAATARARPRSTTCSAAASSSTCSRSCAAGSPPRCRATGSRRWRSSSTSSADAEIRDGGTSIVEYERYMQTRDPAILDAIAAYNREDCVATLLLRDWLLARRAEALERVRAVPAAGAEGAEADRRRRRRSAPRCATSCSTAATRARLAAGLLDYHDRERKPVWWAFFDRLEMSPRGARRGRRVDRAPRADRRARAGQALAASPLHVPGAGAQARRRPEAVRPRDAATARARSSSSTARRARSR